MASAKKYVEIEVERDGSEVSFSFRAGGANMVLTLCVDAASVFSATSMRAVAEDVTEQKFRFTVAGEFAGKSEEK